MPQNMGRRLRRRAVADRAVLTVTLVAVVGAFMGALNEKETLPESAVSLTTPCMPESTFPVESTGN